MCAKTGHSIFPIRKAGASPHATRSARVLSWYVYYGTPSELSKAAAEGKGVFAAPAARRVWRVGRITADGTRP